MTLTSEIQRDIQTGQIHKFNRKQMILMIQVLLL